MAYINMYIVYVNPVLPFISKSDAMRPINVYVYLDTCRQLLNATTSTIKIYGDVCTYTGVNALKCTFLNLTETYDVIIIKQIWKYRFFFCIRCITQMFYDESKSRVKMKLQNARNYFEGKKITLKGNRDVMYDSCKFISREFSEEKSINEDCG